MGCGSERVSLLGLSRKSPVFNYTTKRLYIWFRLYGLYRTCRFSRNMFEHKLKCVLTSLRLNLCSPKPLSTSSLGCSQLHPPPHIASRNHYPIEAKPFTFLHNHKLYHMIQLLIHRTYSRLGCLSLVPLNNTHGSFIYTPPVQ